MSSEPALVARPKEAGDGAFVARRVTRGSSWVTWAALVAITVLGVALRAVFVGDQSLGYEEWYTFAVASHSSVASVWRAVNASESTPPLYYVLTWLSLKVTSNADPTSLRIVSLLAGSLTIPVAFFATRRFFDTRLSLVVAGLFAVSPEMVSYSIYARSYALLVLLSAASMWALGGVLERPSGRRWALWGLAASACLWTHYFAVFFVVAEATVLFVLLPGQRRKLLLAVGAIAVATAPLWPLVLSQSGATDRTAYIAATPLLTRLEYTVRQFSMGSNVPTAWLEASGILLVVGAALFGLMHDRRSRSTHVLIAIIVIGGGVPILTALVGIDDHYLDRNIVGIWICLAPLAAYGLVQLRGVPLVIYGAICLVTVVWVQTNWQYQGSPDWSGASARVHGRAAGEPIAVMPGIEQPVAAYYLDRAALPAPVKATDLWVMIQPARGPQERALNPVPDPPLTQLWGPQFRDLGEIDYRGFRMIHLHAGTPTTVSPLPGNDGPADQPLALVLSPAP